MLVPRLCDSPSRDLLGRPVRGSRSGSVVHLGSRVSTSIRQFQAFVTYELPGHTDTKAFMLLPLQVHRLGVNTRPYQDVVALVKLSCGKPVKAALCLKVSRSALPLAILSLCIRFPFSCFRLHLELVQWAAFDADIDLEQCTAVLLTPWVFLWLFLLRAGDI